MRIYISLLIALLVSLSIVSASERGFPDVQTEGELQKLYKKVRPAYVFVEGGSGAVISEDGLIVTNHHVVGSRKKKFDIRLGDGRSFKADLLGLDVYGDVALLKIQNPKDLKYLSLGNSDEVRIGEFCIAVGNPFGMGVVDQEPTVSFGVISANHVLQGNYTDAIVTDAPINPGNSGGPLINMKGELIGVNGQIRPRWGLRSNTGLGYAIPANQIKMWLPLLKKAGGKNIYHGWILGLTVENDQNSERSKAIVKEVKAGSDAEKAGFKPGDELLSFEGKEVRSRNKFYSVLGTFPAGREVTVKVKRNAQDQDLKFKLEERRPGKLGFSFAQIKRNDKFLKIKNVEKGSHAEKAGMKKGDQIVAIMGTRLQGNIIQQAMAVQRWVQNVPRQFEVKFTVKRGNKEIELAYETE